MTDILSAAGQPQGYTAMVLEHLGADDPVEVQRQTSPALRRLIQAAGRHLRTRPADGGWSALELVGHILDSEYIASIRYRSVIAEDQPTLAPYDQDGWVQTARYSDADPAEILGLFDALRAANLRLWERSTREQRSRVGIHAERGSESYDLIFRLVAGHGRFHIKQIWTTLETIKASVSATC